MNLTKTFATLCVALGLGIGTAQAANVPVPAGEITTSTTWTSDNVYNLQGQVYVTNGATLTIEAGTRIESTAGAGGSLAITRGSKIIAVGTASNPIVFTSSNDTGVDRTGSNEWGNLTLMGRGYVGSYRTANNSDDVTTQDGAGATPYTNTPKPTGLNKAPMEGLTADFTGDPKVLYGGSNDDDDSGSLAYVSFRFGGKVVSLTNELNGLSMGAIGRETDVHHIDIFCNVDDGVETWGGTVNYKYLSIWRIGDDSFDVDQGWRGKAQFVLIVQGYSVDDEQGSGAGDNAFETDGAEAPDAQPVTTATIYNATVIGQPNGQKPGVLPGTFEGAGSDQGFEFRDGARVQYRNCLMIDIGGQLVRATNSESATAGPWGNGYGFTANGGTTLAWNIAGASNDVWDTAYTEAWNKSNLATGGHPNLSPAGTYPEAFVQDLYQAQSAGDPSIGQGFLCEITDSAFFNIGSNGEGDALGVTVAGSGNAAKGNETLGSNPLSYTREAYVELTNTVMSNIIALDPRPSANIVSTASAPADGFFTPAKFKGAFSKDVNWLVGWTAADEFGILTGPANPTDPTATMTVTALTSFPTEAGKTYVVESSTDGVTWSPFAVVEGDGSTVKVADLDGFDGAAVYRVTVQ